MTKTTEYGDKRVLRYEILRSVVGSGVHGIAIEGTDDHDEMGVYISPPEHLLGPTGEYVMDRHARREDYIYRSQPEGARSGPGDIDLVVYSLRKYLALAMKGNPTALLPLYAPEANLVVTSPLGTELRAQRDHILSQDSVWRVLGYMTDQHERMMGKGKRNRVPNRPELVEQHGWDVKYGSHALRLAHQGLEMATSGTLTLPMPETDRQEVLAVKRGEVSQAEVTRRIEDIAAVVRHTMDKGKCPLRPRADLQRLITWSVSAHRRRWGWDAE